MSEKTAALSLGAEITDENRKEARVYVITKVLGRGGFGITYFAESTIYDNNIPQKGIYTIKEFCLSDVCERNEDGSLSVTASGKADFDSAMKDFEHEAERLKSLRHRGIVPVNEVFHANGTVYYVMQYLGDTTLAKYVEDKGGKLSEDEACTIIEKIGQALDYLHQQRITHLDVKPVNVMMVRTPRKGVQPVLIDFGLATHYKTNGTSTSRHGASGVSDGYSPLEQYSGIEKFSPEADVYALGATLLFMLTGKKPEKAANMNATVLKNAVSGLNLSNATTKALMGAMQKSAENRTQSVQEFFNLLQDNDWDGSGHEGSGDGNSGDITHPRKRKNGTSKQGLQIDLKFVLIALAALLLVGGGLWLALRDNTSQTSSYEQTEVDVIDVPDDSNSGSSSTDSGSLTADSDSSPSGSSSTGSGSSSTGSGSSSTSSGSSSSGSNSSFTDNSIPAPPTPVITTGTKNLGYATYRGQLKNGVPEGQGTLTFSKDRRIGSYQIEAGNTIQGEFSDGQLEYGTWHKSDGTSEQIIVGGI